MGIVFKGEAHGREESARYVWLWSPGYWSPQLMAVTGAPFFTGMLRPAFIGGNFNYHATFLYHTGFVGHLLRMSF